MHRCHRQIVAALVVGLVAVRRAAEPVRVADDLPELDGVAAAFDEIEQLLPELTVRDRLLDDTRSGVDIAGRSALGR